MSAPAGFADDFGLVFGRVDANGLPANNALRRCKRAPGTGTLNFYHGVSFLEFRHFSNERPTFHLELGPILIESS